NQLQTMFDPAANADSSKQSAIENGLTDYVAGHTLALDGQSGTDTYVINTTGTQPCFGSTPNGSSCHNYVIDVLDTGDPADGSDVLIVNGFDNTAQSGYLDANAGVNSPTDDIFLLRRSNFIGASPTSGTQNSVAEDPAFVALLHGNFGLSNTVFSGNVTAFNSEIACTSCNVGTDDFLTEGFKPGQRIHVADYGAGVFAGDYTISTATAT